MVRPINKFSLHSYSRYFLLSLVVCFFTSSLRSNEARPLIEILNELQTRFGVTFLYESASLKGKKADISLLGNSSLEEILQNILPPLQLQYEKIKTGAYAIYSTEQKGRPGTLGRKVSITGTIRNKADETLPGVSIYTRDRKFSTVSDSSGNYHIQVPDSCKDLFFSSLGYRIKKENISKEEPLNITLDPFITELQEMVVIGYGSRERRDLTGAISSIPISTSAVIPLPSFESGLQGRAAGIQLVNNSGSPSAEMMIRIRGNTSLLAENRPLYIVDGVPVISGTYSGFYLDRSLGFSAGQHVNILSDLNTSDIESIDVLKDASSAAIYGSRGANGVILITTKHPGLTREDSEKIKINYSTYYGLQRVAKRINLLNASQYAAYAGNAILNSGGADSVVKNTGYDTDWQQEIFRIAPVSNHHISISSATEKTGLYLSGGSFKQEGIIAGSDYVRNNARINMDHLFSEKFKTGTSITFIQSNNHRVPEGINSIGVLATALQRNPNLPVLNPSGDFSDDPAGIENPARTAREITFNLNEKRCIANAYGLYNFRENLRMKSSVSADFISMNEDLFVPSTLQTYRSGNFSFGASSQELLLVQEHTFHYDKTWKEKHHVSSLLGFGNQHANFRSLYLKNSNGNGNTNTNVGNGNNPSGLESPRLQWNLSSFFGRVNYDISQRYLFSASLRADGTSRFGDKQKYAAFPSLAMAWRVSSEHFFRNIKWMDELKLRLSYGRAGNQEGIGDFDRKGISLPSSGYVSGNPAWNALPDANLLWESSHHFNSGIDLNLFSSRLILRADAYIKNSANLLMSVFLPLGTSYQEVVRNASAMENKGLEVFLHTKNCIKKFRWTTEFNIAFNRNKVTKMPVRNNPSGDPNSKDFTEYISAFGNQSPSSIFREGVSFGSFYGYVYEGVNPQTGAAVYRDLNGDGKIDNTDQTLIGNALPKHTGGLANTFSFYNLELEVFLQWSHGNQVYNMTKAILDNSVNADKYNATTDVLNRWQKPGDITDIPKPMNGSKGSDLALPSSRWVEDGSYLRMKTITLSYRFKEKTLSKMKLREACIYLSLLNWITFTHYSGLDPESQNTSNKNSQLGIDIMTYPSPKTMMAGVRIGI